MLNIATVATFCVLNVVTVATFNLSPKILKDLYSHVIGLLFELWQYIMRVTKLYFDNISQHYLYSFSFTNLPSA